MIYGTVQRQAAMLAFVDNFQDAGDRFLCRDSGFDAAETAAEGGSAPVH